MQYEWDETKRQINIEKHAFDFVDMEFFNWEDAHVFEDVRHKYEELRFIAYGYIRARLVVVVYTMRGDAVRVISLRKANKREVIQYEKQN